MASDSDVKMLLNFVNLASSDIKAALDKSAPCRRSVDHRKAPAEKEPLKMPGVSLVGRVSAWSCCPFQYHGQPVYPSPPGALPQSPMPSLGLWRKSAASPGELAHFCKDAEGPGQKVYRPVVLKPIPTKPAVPPPIFNVFGYL